MQKIRCIPRAAVVVDDVFMTDSVATASNRRTSVSEKRKRVYEALLDGATEGLSGNGLFDFVLERCPKATSKKIVRASLLALTDPDVTDRNVLHTIYALAISHRMDQVGSTSDPDDDETPTEKTPVLRKLKKKRTSASAPAEANQI
jgi:hypothetical protein